jgi:hypothetical protein
MEISLLHWQTIKVMNGIMINNKQYIFIETSEDFDCDKCDLNDKAYEKDNVFR